MADLAAIGCPVLAITGGKDIQVYPADVERIAAAVMAETCLTEGHG